MKKSFSFCYVPYRSFNLCSKTVTGTVTGEDNLPLSGAIITEKGTNNKSTSDQEGKFNISASGENAVLTISMSGFKSQEIPTSGKTTISITLFSTTPEKHNKLMKL